MSPLAVALPGWIIACLTILNTWIQYRLKNRYDISKDYIEMHSGEEEDEEIKEEVRKEKAVLERYQQLNKLDTLRWIWYSPHEKGLLVGLAVLVYKMIDFLIKEVILAHFWLLTKDFPPAFVKWCRTTFRRKRQTQDVEAQDFEAEEVDPEEVETQEVEAEEVETQEVEAEEVEAQGVETQDIEAQDVEAQADIPQQKPDFSWFKLEM